MANYARYEPTIDEILADPTVKALMKADRVNPDRLQMKLMRLRHALAVKNTGEVPGIGFTPDHPGTLGMELSACQA